MELIRENTVRRIDSLGRVSIPKGMRNRNNIEINDEVEFFTLRDHGKEYICVARHDEESDNPYAKVAAFMQELGLEVPDVIADQI